MRHAGFVLVGGRSSRMGRDKALLPYRETSLVNHVAEQVRVAAGSAVLIGSPERYSHLGLPALPDLYPGEGPLGGILTALSHSSAEYNLVVACDMPLLRAEFLRSLLEIAEKGAAECLVPISPGGRPEPLCAVYRATALQKIETIFTTGVRKMRTALDMLQTIYHEIEDSQPFSNMNTPDDWESHLDNRQARR